MSRTLPTQIADAIDSDEAYLFWAVELLFDGSDALRLWSGLGDLVLDSNTYTGAGELISLSEIQENSDIAAYGATITLSGIPSNILDKTLAVPYQGRKAAVHFGVITDPNSTTPTYTSLSVFTGEMDQMNINYGPETCVISLDVESRLVDLQRSRIRRYTNESQKSRFPDDDAFEFITRLQNEQPEWKTNDPAV